MSRISSHIVTGGNCARDTVNSGVGVTVTLLSFIAVHDELNRSHDFVPQYTTLGNIPA